MKKIILCADDFGQNPAVSAGIIDLIAAQRLSATSCMTNSSAWLSQASKLKPYIGQVDIGLHFNLTEGRALAQLPQLAPQGKLPTLMTLIAKSQLRLISKREVVAELTAQLQAFKQAMGCLPSYIDGHQHVHQFPVIREALVEVYAQYYPEKTAYVRILNFKPRDFKARVLRILGAEKLHRLLHKQGIPHNRSFSGIYYFEPDADYRCLFQQFLTQVGQRGLIMCHPGLASDDKADPIAIARINEYRYFSSEAFITDCQHAEVEITTFADASL